ncbi:MAG: helicase, partial [Chloroflexi bacterium]
IFPLKEGPVPPWSPEAEEQPDVVVRGLIRRSEDSWTVTLFLVNEQREPEKRRDEAWVFQPELSVSAPDGAPIFQHRSAISRRWRSDEELAMTMLYRRHVSFAIGHGIGVHAETVPGDPARAVRLSTRVVPTYDVPRTEAPTTVEIPGLTDLVLDMKELAECPMAALAGKLMPLVTAYAAWIAEQTARIDDPEAGLAAYHRTAGQAMEECQRTLARIQEGITLLSNNRHAAQAFSFMNKAMWQQRIHTLYAEVRRRGQSTPLGVKDRPENRSWRPFQLAFILLNLPALTDLHHPDRSEEASAMADLLWFPTGGGKTEAYLGLTAYTLAIRRLQGTVAGRSGEEGVAVIMRYTLRLLTLQQFQRATALICACEILRREDKQSAWGETPFRLGLWVGQRTTPNTTEQSEESSRQDRGLYQRGSAIGGVGSPRQLTNCPWCGSPIDAGRDIKIEPFAKGRGRTFIYCGDLLGRCPFSRRNSPEGLPVLVVDEEIYRCLPALLIATVDKFAQMPWNGATQMLFGKVDKRCSRHGFHCPDLEDKDQHRAVGSFPAARSAAHRPLRPPDLIIQDELHLISGPLGTLVALYETAVDRLSTWEVDGKRVRPKVVAATATIRRAAQQVQALFMRQVNVFPPQGLDVTDNFFARQREPDDAVPGRRYMGICASGRRLKAALIRVYVAYLSAGQYLYHQYGQTVDPWMTLVGYFNSMNELGGMRRLVEDDVRSRLNRMEQRGLARRNAPLLEELTSRKSSTDIPDVLDKLERVFDPARDPTSPRPLDVLLATNMISVGVDVKRLGLMVVAGQPKTTAEYIQATSRVGRNAPGLVCVVFNWARPRDLSHYEQFEHYHATFYQQVEALSVTPFAPRAIDRGLAALLVSYVRLLGSEFNENSQAGKVTGTHPYFLAALNDLSRRAVSITGSTEVGEVVRTTLEELRKYWLNMTKANVGTQLGYKTRKDGKTIGLLRQPGQRDWTPFTCLNSWGQWRRASVMRDQVETERQRG